MKKYLFMLIPAFVLAGDATFKVCNYKTCYDQKLDAKSFQWMEDSNGDRFLRVYLSNGNIVDITCRDLTVEIPKSVKPKR
jgi:hypothetical protein